MFFEWNMKFEANSEIKAFILSLSIEVIPFTKLILKVIAKKVVSLG